VDASGTPLALAKADSRIAFCKIPLGFALNGPILCSPDKGAKPQKESAPIQYQHGRKEQFVYPRNQERQREGKDD
jgi:hypothetical protein